MLKANINDQGHGSKLQVHVEISDKIKGAKDLTSMMLFAMACGTKFKAAQGLSEQRCEIQLWNCMPAPCRLAYSKREREVPLQRPPAKSGTSPVLDTTNLAMKTR